MKTFGVAGRSIFAMVEGCLEHLVRRRIWRPFLPTVGPLAEFRLAQPFSVSPSGRDPVELETEGCSRRRCSRLLPRSAPFAIGVSRQGLFFFAATFAVETGGRVKVTGQSVVEGLRSPRAGACRSRPATRRQLPVATVSGSALPFV